jgi:predicted RNA-binding Zn ribbon-like protein
MTASHDHRPDILFVGEHLALDFLNTVASPHGKPIEWLRDGNDLVNWLQRAGAFDADIAAHFLIKDQNSRLNEIVEEARTLREWLREFVLRHAGKPLHANVIKELVPLNKLLSQDKLYHQIVKTSGREGKPLLLKQERDWVSSEQLLYPIVEAIGDLVCNVDFNLVRRCENKACTIVFYDRTKSHARRWCSMQYCGNRAKAAAHRARQRLRSSP